MSLTDRVRAVELERKVADSGASRGVGLEELRRGVQAYVSMESLAAAVVESPDLARSELRHACRQVFVEPAWAQVGLARKHELVEELIDLVFGLGPIESLLDDESVTEIMVNGCKSIYCERDGKLERLPIAFESDAQVRVLIDRIIGPLGRRIDESSPMVNARLDQGHRVHAIIPPLAIDGPMLTIRAFTRRVMTLEEMVGRGSIDEAMRILLSWAVIARKSVAVSGGTGSGKTTMLNALSCLIPHDERVVTIEDSAELKFTEHPHVIRLEARPANAEGVGEVSIRDLVINSLRMRPDRIVVGECRGGEAADMLQAMLTGHSGSLTTLHANSPREVIERMISMVRYAVDLPVDVIEAQIGSAFDLIVQTARSHDGARYVSEVVEVSFDPVARRCCFETLFTRLRSDEEGIWWAAPTWMEEVLRLGWAEEEVREWTRHLRAG